MSKYTTELRFICEAKSGIPEDELFEHDPFEITALAVDNIFKDDLVIGDAEYDSHIKQQILLHYYTREICEETFGLWKLRVNTRLREKLQYYNTLYDALQKQYDIAEDPFVDVDYEVTKEEQNSTDTSGNESIDRTGSGTHYDYTTKDLETAKTGTESTDEEATLDKTGSGTSYSYTDIDNTHTKTGTEREETEGYSLHSDTPEGSVAGIDAEISGMEGSGFLSDAQKVTDDKTTTYNTTDTDDNSSKTDNGDTRNYHDASEGNTTTTFNTSVEETGTSKIDGGDTRNYNDSREYVDSKTGEVNISEAYKGKRNGKSLMEILSEFKDKLMNLDEIIINDFSDLFIMLW